MSLGFRIGKEILIKKLQRNLLKLKSFGKGLSSFLIISFFLIPFLLPWQPVQAAAESYSIKITSPKDKGTVSSPVFPVSVAYAAINFPKTALGWKVHLEMHRVEWNPAIGQYTDMGGGYNGFHEVSGPSGTYTVNVDFTQKPQTPGLYEVYTSLMVETKMMSDADAARLHLTPNVGSSTLASDTIYINYTYKASGGIPGSADTSIDNSDSGETNPLPGILGLGGLVALAGLLAKYFTSKGKKTQVKTSPGTSQPPPRKPNLDKMQPPVKPRTGPDTRPKELIEAEKKYLEALKSKKAFDRMHKMREAVYDDNKLVEFIDSSRKSIIGPDGLVDENKLNKLEGTVKNWIVRDKMTQQHEYDMADAWQDSFRDWRSATTSLPAVAVRIGVGYVTAGVSELAFIPVSAVTSMGETIARGRTTGEAVAVGLLNTVIEVGTGEMVGVAIKGTVQAIKGYTPVAPPPAEMSEGYKAFKLSKINPELSSNVNNINKVAKSDPYRYSRDIYMKDTEVMGPGKATAGLDDFEKQALELNNNPEFRKVMSENQNLFPDGFKDVAGTAKQKAYQTAQNSAVKETLNHMRANGVDVDGNTYLINQTGTHAQAKNPGFKVLKSDFDHTVDFESAEYNQFYEKSLNTNLESMGTSTKALDVNVYGEGTTSKGAYTGSGGEKFVNNYNQTWGKQTMIRSDKGAVTISQETPQTTNSLLNMNADDVTSAKSNFKDFFKSDMEKGGSLNTQIENGAKTVSRTSKINVVENFQQTGKITNVQSPCEKASALIKDKGTAVSDAAKQTGYNDNNQLLNDMKKFMGF